ncbi:AraC family transcriptional regulator [Massilia sp. B-10]|nr:AraC family transcriptional regulator [Massilia sp. B-10]
MALRLFQRGCDNDAVARHLGFHDANNFRRSFKRWTGLTPMLLREKTWPHTACNRVKFRHNLNENSSHS